VTRITNRNILYLFAILVAMSIACSIGGLAITVSFSHVLMFFICFISLIIAIDHERK
jgi:Mn2+/Fe2+ NRAMP family transporter